MRETVGVFPVQSYSFQKFIDSLGTFFLIVHFMDLHTLGNNASYRHTGIQRSIWILENDLSFPGIIVAVLCMLHVYFFSIVKDFSACGRVNSHYHTSKSRFTTSGLAYHTQSLTFIDVKGNIIYSHQVPAFSYMEMFGHMV